MTYWASLGSPCVGAFVPLFLDARVPEVLQPRRRAAVADSPWWRFKQLLSKVEQDWDAGAPRVRRELDEFEAEITEHMRTRRIATQSPADRAAFVRTTVDDLLHRVRRLIAALSRVEPLSLKDMSESAQVIRFVNSRNGARLKPGPTSIRACVDLG